MTFNPLSFPAEERAPSLRTISATELLSRDWPPRENLLSPWLPKQGLAMLYGMRGLGKSHFALGIAWAIATGGEFLRWSAPKAANVLYIDGEMCGPLLNKWLAEIVGDAPLIPDGLKFLTPDEQERGIPDLSTPEGQAKIEELTEDVDLIILDNKSTLCRTGDDNAASDWQPMQEWMLNLRARGKSVLLIHHAGKNGSARGSSMIEVPLDTVIALKKPVDHDPTAGLVAEVHFEKARAIYGDDVKPFEARYETDNDFARWTTRGLEDVELQRVVALANEGMKQRDISKELNISLGKVNKLHKEARSVGLIGGKG